VFSFGTMGGSQSSSGAQHLEARRLRAIDMVSQGASQAAVAREVGVSREAVRQWVEAYRAGGPAAVASRPRRRRGLVPLRDVEEAIEQRRPSGPLTTLGVQELVARAYGVAYSRSSVRTILRRLGYVYSRDEGWRHRHAPHAKDASLRAG